MRKNKKRKLKKSILIIVDGESEQIYLNSIKTSNIHIKPELPKKKSLKELFNYFKSEKKPYDNTYWIVDLDVVIKNNQLNDIKNYKEKYENILINNPCLEFWFVLHYELKNFDNNCDKVISYLKRNYDDFKTYDKSKNEVIKISKKLNSKLVTAIENAKKRDCDFDALLSCSQMYKLFEEVFNG